MEIVLRLLAEIGPAAAWTGAFAAAVVSAFVLYIGIAMLATLAVGDARKAKMRYMVFRDLLELFRRRR